MSCNFIEKRGGILLSFVFFVLAGAAVYTASKMPRMEIKGGFEDEVERVVGKPLSANEMDALVCGMSEKLGIISDRGLLMKWYDGEQVDPSFRAFKDDECERKEWEIRNAEWPHQFPWPDVVASIYKHPDMVYYTEVGCPECGDEMLHILFRSPEHTWRSMCGRSGEMLICERCFKQRRTGVWNID